MAPVIPDPKKIRSFPTEAAFERWLAANHARETEVWLKIHKKGSGLPTVTHAQAIDVALCWGWIDGLRKSFDETSFLQRFTPRRPKSIWSQVNRDNVARLAAAGRWDAAYAPKAVTFAAGLPRDATALDRRTFLLLGRVELVRRALLCQYPFHEVHALRHVG